MFSMIKSLLREREVSACGCRDDDTVNRRVTKRPRGFIRNLDIGEPCPHLLQSSGIPINDPHHLTRGSVVKIADKIRSPTARTNYRNSDHPWFRITRSSFVAWTIPLALDIQIAPMVSTLVTFANPNSRTPAAAGWTT